MNDSTCHTATLLMESHGLAPNVRSNSFSSTQVWSKLYQAGSYFVDLNLSPDEYGLRLHGEILTEDDTNMQSEATVTLHDSEGALVASAPLGNNSSSGDTGFVFDIEDTDDYHLEVVFEQEALSVPGVEVR